MQVWCRIHFYRLLVFLVNLGFKTVILMVFSLVFADFSGFGETRAEFYFVSII
jgi:hypothetical protein